MSDDIVEIGQLLNAYCHAVDRGSAAEVARLFAADAVLRPVYDGDYELVGRAEVERWYAFYHAHFRAGVRHLKHMVMSPTITVEGNRARSVSYLLAAAVGERDDAGFFTTGTYRDELVREAGRWRFAVRIIEVEWTAPASTVVERFPPLNFPAEG